MNAIDIPRNGVTQNKVKKVLRSKEAEFLGPVNFALQVACVVGLVWVTLTYWV